MVVRPGAYQGSGLDNHPNTSSGLASDAKSLVVHVGLASGSTLTQLLVSLSSTSLGSSCDLEVGSMSARAPAFHWADGYHGYPFTPIMRTAGYANRVPSVASTRDWPGTRIGSPVWPLTRSWVKVRLPRDFPSPPSGLMVRWATLGVKVGVIVK